jgi:hypothetical protein
VAEVARTAEPPARTNEHTQTRRTTIDRDPARRI